MCRPHLYINQLMGVWVFVHFDCLTNAAVNICVQIFGCACFISLGYTPAGGIAYNSRTLGLIS